MERLKLCDSEYRLMDMIWDDNPITAANLADKCEKEFGWKKPTVYTMLKRMAAKNYITYEEKVVEPLIERDQVNESEGEVLLDKAYGGSLSNFVAAFLKNRKLPKEDAQRIREMIEEAMKEE